MLDLGKIEFMGMLILSLQTLRRIGSGEEGLKKADSDPVMISLTSVSLTFQAGVSRVRLISVRRVLDQHHG